MSRGRSDARERPSVDRPPIDRGNRKPGVPMHRLTLPRQQDRQAVRARGRVYHLRESESRILATVGTFRVVRADDLAPVQSSRDAWRGDLESLATQGLVEPRTVDVNRQAIAVVVLTRAGKDVLEACRPWSDRPRQEFHVGLVKTRELGHDSQLYRLFQAEAARIESDGGRVERVVLDYELKREYQQFLHRADRQTERDDDRMEAFAAAANLPIVDGHIEFPDLRIEYESPDGRIEHRDVELVTEHYSRSQLAGKAAAGFRMYRAAGSARSRGGSSRAGGTPFDPHNLEWLR